MQIVKLGVKDYIAKPFQGEQLIERVKKYLPLEQKKISTYFIKENDIDIILFPSKLTSHAANEIKEQLRVFIKEGSKKIITNMTNNESLDLSVVQLLGVILYSCEKAQIKPLVVAQASLAKELKAYQETVVAIASTSMEDAKKLLEN
jgi:anti-anti-sigma regulatory factor